MEKKNKKTKLNPDRVAIIASIMALIGLYLFSYNYIIEKKQMAYDYMAADIYDNSQEEVANVLLEYEEGEKEQPEEEVITNDYIGYLEIPKINLNKGFLNVKSEENDVEKNLYVVPGSNYPNKKNGNLIIAAHSGTGWKAFFNDLYKLEKSDVAYVRYKGMKYTYEVVNIYTHPKTGSVKIERDYEKSTLTLITCTNNDDTTQTVYILELTSATQE